jgi:hypothetical protein
LKICFISEKVSHTGPNQASTVDIPRLVSAFQSETALLKVVCGNHHDAKSICPAKDEDIFKKHSTIKDKSSKT